ncbi:MAG TPA: aldehyde dehydrogenase family protein [Acidimicrobiia bacterium]|jgi:aldehyde dehydrogenase (NAD+)
MAESVTGEARMLIDGALVEAASGARYDNVNPATEEVIGQTADAGPADMERAVAAARRAFEETDWASDPELRKRGLRQLHEALAKEREVLRPILVAEVGTPVGLTYAVQMDSCIDDMEWDIECIDRIEWEYDLPDHEFFGMRSARRVLREPIGVVGAITPWNFPFMLNLSKIVPALAAGNSVILKPAPDTPWSATHIGRIVAEYTDIPAGVFNVVTSGDPAAVGEVLSGSRDVDMISFTGSTVVGKRIMAQGSETLKRVFLELGGKSANIILDDADFPAQMGSGAMVCMHGGQGCAITTRMLVPRSRYDEAIDLLRAGFEGWSYGDPTDPANLQGPLINARQRERVLGLIEKGKSEGSRVVVGGGRPPQLEKGYYVEPTLFVDVDPDSTIAQEEIFGPVLAVIPYEDDDDAVRIANNSRYGLSGAVNGTDLDRAYGIAKRLRTGTVAVNGGQWFGPDSPFGGYKESGLGREHGVPGFEEYLETKTIGLPPSS